MDRATDYGSVGWGFEPSWAHFLSTLLAEGFRPFDKLRTGFGEEVRIGFVGGCYHEKFMELALREAELAFKAGEAPVGAVVVLQDEVLGSGHNQRETFQDPTAHAEMIALRKACQKLNSWRLVGATMYVTLEPCGMCAGALVLARITHLVYGVSDPKAGAVGSLYNLVQDPRLNHQIQVTSGILQGACGGILRAFFGELRREKSWEGRC